MKCQKCQVKEATNHMTEIINGKKQELHLCEECAASSPAFQEMKAGFDFGVGDFLGGLFGGKQKSIHAENTVERKLVCPVCHMPFEEFLQKGRLGCGECYNVFRSRLERPLKQIHGTCEHVGKVPGRMGGTMQIGRQINKLETELSAAVLKQEFERAAELRDQIQALKEKEKKEQEGA